MNKDLIVNVVTITEDNGSYSADKNYAELLKGFKKGKGAAALYENMIITLVAMDNGFYFAAEIMNQYIMIVLNGTGVTCTISGNAEGNAEGDAEGSTSETTESDQT